MHASLIIMALLQELASLKESGEPFDLSVLLQIIPTSADGFEKVTILEAQVSEEPEFSPQDAIYALAVGRRYAFTLLGKGYEMRIVQG